MTYAATNRAKTHCLHGHKFTPENTAVNKKGGRSCRQCSRVAHKKYYREQNPELRGFCPLCKRGPKVLVRDHDHLSGKQRGHICHSCNLLLGRVGDDTDTIESLKKYLQFHGKKKIYLSGGIAGLTPPEVEDFFLQTQKKLEAIGLKVLSPIRGKKLDAECIQKYEPNEIVTRDLNDIGQCDLMVAYPSTKSIGTFMEIFFAAYVKHIPIVVVAQNEHIRAHYWIRFFASKVVSTMDEAIKHIRDWYL